MFGVCSVYADDHCKRNPWMAPAVRLCTSIDVVEHGQRIAAAAGSLDT